MLANMGCYNLAMLRCRVREDILDQVVSVLVAGYINKGNARPVNTAFANPIKVAAKKIRAANFQTFLNNLGGELVHAVLSCIPDDVVDGTASVGRGTMLADVLNTPVAKLTMGNNINVGKDLLNTGPLEREFGMSVVFQGLNWSKGSNRTERLTLSSSRQFSNMFWTTRLPVSPRATSCHIP